MRPSRSFEQAAAEFVLENQHKRSLDTDVGLLKQLMPWIGHLPLERIHREVLQPYVGARREESRSAGTINHGLKIVRRVLNLAAQEWMDEYGLTWLASAPKVKLLPDTHKRPPYPLNWEEQTKLFQRLPDHLAQMALFAINTGCRDGEICKLRWEWELKLQSMNASVFIIPGSFVKNGDERLVVLNRIAMSVVKSKHGKHATRVFCYQGKPVL